MTRFTKEDDDWIIQHYQGALKEDIVLRFPNVPISTLYSRAVQKLGVRRNNIAMYITRNKNLNPIKRQVLHQAIAQGFTTIKQLKTSAGVYQSALSYEWSLPTLQAFCEVLKLEVVLVPVNDMAPLPGNKTIPKP